MKKYYKLIKTFPNSYGLKSIFFIDESDNVYFTNNKKVSDIYTLDDSYCQSDLEMTEYFEESIGISADNYILFNNDIVYGGNAMSFALNKPTLALLCTSIYFKKENIPVAFKTWEDLKSVNGFFIDSDSSFHLSTGGKCISDNKNVFKTKKQALSTLAFAQLSQLVAEINGSFIVDWNNNDKKYVITRVVNGLLTASVVTSYYPLAFKNESDRDFSFEHHNQLWMEFYEL